MFISHFSIRPDKESAILNTVNGVFSEFKVTIKVSRLIPTMLEFILGFIKFPILCVCNFLPSQKIKHLKLFNSLSSIVLLILLLFFCGYPKEQNLQLLFFFFYTTWYELVVYSFPGNADIFRTSIVTIRHVWPFEHESNFNKKIQSFSCISHVTSAPRYKCCKRLASTPLGNPS